MCIRKDDSIKDIVASLWSSVSALDKLSKVFLALLQPKLLLLGKVKDKKNSLTSQLANARRGLTSIQCRQERDANCIYLENTLRSLR